ncbi:MAG TPA: DUF4397 domain-containing protein, partial [Actinomycetes bacterium]|nr:DUF4397 domain-containing protein [Actinomycetes bacterium]
MAVLLSILLVMGLATSATAKEGEAMVRVLHLSPQVGAVDVEVDGKALLSAVPFKAASSYRRVPAGTHTLAVRPPSSASPASVRASVRAGAAYTVVALGGAAGLEAFVVKDDFSAPPPGKARLRIINGAPQSPPLDIGTAGGPVLFENVAFGKVSPFVAVPAGSLSLEARMAGTSRVLFSQGASRLPAGTILTVAGTVSGSGAIEMVPIVDAAGARSLPRGGVATGAGGTAGPRPPAPWLAGLILLLGTAAAARRRPGRS